MTRTRSLMFLAGLIGMVMAGTCMADTLYLRDGSKHEGTITQKGDKYVVETPEKTTEYDAAEMVYVRYGPSSSSAPAPVANGGAASRSSAGNGAANTELQSQPESMAFLLMRRLSSTLPGSESVKLRQEIEQWRAAFHDQKRKVGSDWVAAKEFVVHRTRYEALLKEADDVLRKNKGGKGSVLYAKLREAAATWEDPLLREFLTGVAEYESDNFVQAQILLQNCARKAPHVPAFAQAKAMVLLSQNKGLEAVAPAVDFLRLRSDLLDAFVLLKKAVAKAPGTEMKQPVVQEAQDLLGQYQDLANAPSATALRTFNWSMPPMGKTPVTLGKGWYHRDDTLPLPTFDRLVFRQAVAVPITDTLLLVDGNIVTDNSDVFIQINEKNKTVVGAVVKPVPGKPANLPLAVISVPGYTFTPLARGEGPDLAGKSVTLYSLNVFEEMGGDIQMRTSRILSSDENATITPTLRTLPGESAGPVLTEEGQLVQFVGGKTDVTVDNGGADQVYPMSQLGVFFAMGKTKAPAVAAKLKRTGPSEAVAGKRFIVYVVSGERFEN